MLVSWSDFSRPLSVYLYVLMTLCSVQIPVGMETASALKDVQASLYGTSSYNQDFASIMKARHRRESALPVLVLPDIAEQCLGTLQDGDTLSEEEMAEVNKETLSSCDDSSDKDSEDDEMEAEDTITQGHMICTSDGRTVLPDHVIITELSELPSHFRRVTAKYRRNRCPVFPCQVPFYLWRKHQLLPSSITALPPAMAGERREAVSGCLPHLISHPKTTKPSKHHVHKMTRFYEDKNALPKLGTVARKRPMAGTGFVPTETRLPLQHLQGVRRWSHTTESLGRRFKTEAHTRCVGGAPRLINIKLI